uniref:Groucho/TLE N-terminal Q-rich domain-containing protein n=1 Tax=Nothoprocta perdicaria TaxID=30464 RepID=A0A8C6YMN1_NOTPE
MAWPVPKMFPQNRPPVRLRLGLVPVADRDEHVAPVTALGLSLLCLAGGSARGSRAALPSQYYEMSYGLNIEMHKQTEIAKRLNVICAQLIPFLSQEHQQQVVQAVERAKQVTMTDLNAAIGHQLQAQHLPHHAPPIPLTPHPAGLQPPGLAGLAGASGLLALSGALGAQAQLLAKDERGGHDAEHRGERGPARAATGLWPVGCPVGARLRVAPSSWVAQPCPFLSALFCRRSPPPRGQSGTLAP